MAVTMSETDDKGGIVRCDCGRAVPCRIHATPTPIDPADIRPGDVVRASATFEVEQITSDGTIYSTDGAVDLMSENVEAFTWHLVSRPDPDAEERACAWAAYRKDYAPNPPALGAAHRAFLAGWQAAREQGWDVSRPDPDAEVVDAINAAMTAADGAPMQNSLAEYVPFLLKSLRESGWDVVRT